jgi:uncharacterized membrane protein YtjA (UPF0391 family)
MARRSKQIFHYNLRLKWGSEKEMVMVKKKSFLSADMLLLKWPVLLLIICLIASAVWYGGVSKFQKIGLAAMQAAQIERDNGETALRAIEEEEKTIRNYSERYRQLQTSGVIGDETRLELVEALGHIRARHKLYPLQFDIGQQVAIPLKKGSPESAGPYLSLRSSQIEITLPLLHEDDLTRLLQELRNVGRGVFVVEECSISRGSGVEKESLELKENLSAVCKIFWLTLKPEAPREAEGGVAPPPMGR